MSSGRSPPTSSSGRRSRTRPVGSASHLQKMLTTRSFRSLVRGRSAVLPSGADLSRFRPLDPAEARRELGLDPAELRTPDGVEALEGFDPVGYFPEGGGKPMKGLPELELVHRGVRYHFASKSNRERFEQDPERFEHARQR